MASVNEKVFVLQCAVKNNAWGKIGEQSAVALLAKSQPNFEFDSQSPYAELWMGSHHKGPSLIKTTTGTTTDLSKLLKSNPSLVGENLVKHFGTTSLPYLFKVLSINKTLAIQAHPNKEHAEILHKTKPEIYQDDNHKPEIAIAITPFEALCGFRSATEIIEYFDEVPELMNVVGQDTVNHLIESEMSTASESVEYAIKRCISRLMKCDPQTITKQLCKLVSRIENFHQEGTKATSQCLGSLLLRVHSQYPGDVGCFMIFFLNYIQLQPFESIFFFPNVPHAYISGDIIECMANADNVVRGGFTSKFKDLDVLIDMLDYQPQTVEFIKLLPTESSSEGDPFSSVYNPPVDEFSVKKIQIPIGKCHEYAVKPINGPSILLTVSGKADVIYGNDETTTSSLPVHRGSVLFIGNSEQVVVRNIAEDEELLMFQAYCELGDWTQE